MHSLPCLSPEHVTRLFPGFALCRTRKFDCFLCDDRLYHRIAGRLFSEERLPAADRIVLRLYALYKAEAVRIQAKGCATHKPSIATLRGMERMLNEAKETLKDV